MQIVEVMEALLRELIDRPEELFVRHDLSENTLTMKIECPKADRGKIIGIGGRNMDCIKTLSRAMGAKYKTKVFLYLVE